MKGIHIVYAGMFMVGGAFLSRALSRWSDDEFVVLIVLLAVILATAWIVLRTHRAIHEHRLRETIERLRARGLWDDYEEGR